ncbi:MAG: hypothetical protein ABJA66_03385 [Actinomycetota bacterium]
MASQIVEWAIIFSFFFLAFGFIFLEAFYMSKKGWTNFGKAFLCSFLSYAVSFAVCFVVLFVVFGVVIAMSWDGSISKFPGGGFGVGVVLILAALFVPFFTAMCKWLLLKLMKIQKGATAFAFSAISSVITIIISVGVPCLITYFVAGLKF